MRSVAEVYLRDVLASDLAVHFEYQSDRESARLSVTTPRDRAGFDAHWGKGIATAALTQLLAKVGERPLYAAVADHNPASLRVLEKCGFRRIGVERDDEATMHVLRLD